MRKLYIAIVFVIPMLIARLSSAAEHMLGESLVLSGPKPGALLAERIDPHSIVVRSTYLPGGTVYEAIRDYRFDANAGTITRVPGSRIPDFATNVLFGKKNFDQNQFPGYGNGKFFVYVDYDYQQ